MANAEQDSLVISVHDVAPPWLGRVRRLLGVLDRMGARPRVLKVVPNQDGRHDLRRCPELLALLREEQEAGSEIVLHGYSHQAEGPPRGPWDMRWRARLFAGTAAEFATLDEAEMAERLQWGKSLLADAGLRAEGFCAPGWLAPPSLSPMLLRAGFGYLVNMATLEDLATARRIVTPWLGYMGAGVGQEFLISLAGQFNLLAAGRFPVLKVFLHPQAAPDSAACRRSLDRLSQLLRVRRPTTYARLLRR